MTRPRLSGPVTAFILVSSVPAMAVSFQDLTALDVAVAANMGAEIGKPGGARAPVDRRLKLKACPEAPTISGPVLGAAVVRCEPVGWSIRVPLLLDARRNASVSQPGEETRDAVTRGQAVRLTVEGQGFSLSRTMIADATGKIGDMVSVRESRSAKPVLARITAIGEVSVPGS